MKTYPLPSEDADPLEAFEIGNLFTTIWGIARLLRATPGVEAVQIRRPFSKWRDVHIHFRYKGRAFSVEEPFGDNSRLLIRPDTVEDRVDLRDLERAFASYRAPIHRLTAILVRWLSTGEEE